MSQGNQHAQDQQQQQDTPMDQLQSSAPKEPESFEFSATVPSMSAQDL